ncbi:MAG: transposase, partial [Desulfamplus sp.]|nr:transposase [Desulfamplus sp.]
PKLTPTGKLAKNQYDTIKLPLFFQTISSFTKCGFEADKQAGKEKKSLYHTKVITGRLNSIKGKHRIVESIDQRKKTVKYLVTNELTWETTMIISVYSYRWVIEEFFRNAKQLLDMEGAAIRSEQGVTLALCLVSWIDFLLHLENYKQRTAGKLTKDSLTIPSIVRQAQYSNLKALLDRLEKDETFVQKWLKVEKEHIEKKRKKHKQLIEIDNQNEIVFDLAA